MKKLILSVIAVTFFGITLVSAQEQESPSTNIKKWQVRLRGVAIIPDESANINVIGGDASISSAFIPELDFTYFFTKNFAAELVLGTSKHDVNTTGSDISAIGGSANANIDLGSVRLLPPTLTFQYHFYPLADKAFKPYVGAGINYTIFYDAKEGNTVKSIEYDNAVGYAFQLGIDYMLTDKFFINIDAKKLFLSTDVTVDASNLSPGLSIPAEVDIDPWLFGFGVGMKF